MRKAAPSQRSTETRMTETRGCPLSHSRGIRLPVGFEIVRKSERYTDPKDCKQKRRSDKSKNESWAISLTRP